jgi:ribosomal-protein-alanine N-acetyltransferase
LIFKRERRITMGEPQDKGSKTAGDNLGDAFDAFGSAMSQIFNDPKLKEKARDLGRAAKESAETLGDRFKDEEVQTRLKEAGQAAQAFGKNVADFFSEKDKGGKSEK